MRRIIPLWGWATCASFLVLAAPARGQDDPRVLDQKDVRAFAQKRVAGTPINFHKAFNLPFPSLGTLGARIDAARQQADPVALAHTAQELAVAERVSGKKAPLTATMVGKESAQLGLLRKEAAELAALTDLTKQIDGLADSYKAVQEAAAKAAKSGDLELPPKVISTPVFITNMVDEWVYVYVNGQYNMRLPPTGKGFCFAQGTSTPVVVTAFSSSYVWAPRQMYGTFRGYSWELIEPKAE